MAEQVYQTASIQGIKSERVEIDGKPYGKVYGTCYVWNTVGNFGRRGGFQAISDYAFTGSLEKRLASEHRDIQCLRAHDSGRIMARTATELMKVWEDDIGVHYEALLNLEDPDSMGAFTLIEDGTLDASSMGYAPIESKTVEMKDNSIEAVEAGKDIERKVSVASEADLIEISIVTHGVYAGASALAAEKSPQFEGGWIELSQYDANGVIMSTTMYNTYHYEMDEELEVEWQGEPYYSPLVRKKRTTTTTSVDETTYDDEEVVAGPKDDEDEEEEAGPKKDKKESEEVVEDQTESEEESEDTTESEEDPGDSTESGEEPDDDQQNASAMTWEQHFTELEELGVAAFTGSV